ncbi:hypothetical protein ZHAS_00017278 [Anopheles sinensis]|uniref:Uncharacterized protein n=1 Tax=Anopheles sinensis TaxID=74873 RepID=A0A084WFT6_ANOSI|nr:hypothetical protein ZHAS_00017278 [Anopheles sinensis]
MAVRSRLEGGRRWLPSTIMLLMVVLVAGTTLTTSVTGLSSTGERARSGVAMSGVDRSPPPFGGSTR